MPIADAVFSSFFIYQTYFILQVDFVSWITVLLRYTLWTYTLTLLIRFKPFVKYFCMFGTYNNGKKLETINYQTTGQ